MIKLSTITKFFLNFLFILISFYVVQDLMNSKNVNLMGGDRIIVHILLISIIILLIIYNLFYGLNFNFHVDSIKFSLILLNLWIIIVSVMRSVPIQNIFVHFGLSFLWIMSYDFSSTYFGNKFNKEKWFYLWIVGILGLYIIGMLYAQYNISRIDGRVPVLNLIYFVMSFIPWINLIGKKGTSYFLNVIILILVMLSFKRGAIIIYILMVITYFLVRGIIEGNNFSIILKLFIFLTLFIVGIILVNYITDGFLFHRFSRNELLSGSGRDVLYQGAISSIKERNIFDKLVGLGSGSSVALLGNGVHNEWLELLFSYGFVGAALYLNFIFSILIESYRQIKEKNKVAPSFAQAAVLVTAIGLFDGFFFMHSTLYIMLFFGSIRGIKRKEKNEGIKYG